jgi:hypothetical protein
MINSGWIGVTNAGTKQEQLVINAWGTHSTRTIDGNACITGVPKGFGPLLARHLLNINTQFSTS